MENRELVSVITPMYNAQKYIVETIESVIHQSYQNWEMIIVDNCSTDKSREIVENIDDDRIKLIKLDFNSGGPARPRNIGLEHAKGEYIAFLDADDVWLEDKLQKQVEILKCCGYDIVHTLAYNIDENSQQIAQMNNQRVYSRLKYIANDKTIACFTNFININTVLMKNDRSIKFKEDSHLVALEDLYFWIDHLSVGKKPYLIKEKLIKYRVLVNSASNRASDKSFRKLYYMYALLLNENKISLKLFFASYFVNTIKITLRNIKNAFIK